MDHRYIAEHNLVERYLSQRLSPEERERFEDHFVGCEECLDEIELARDFRESLRADVAKQVSQQAVAASLWARLFRHPARSAFLGAALAAAFLAPAFWLFTERRDHVRINGPQVNVPTYTLGAVRGHDPPVLESSTRRWLSLVLDAGEDFPTYRLVLLDASEEVVWQQTDIRPDARGQVILTFPPETIPRGEYQLRLDGIESSGDAVDLQRHDLRIEE